MSQSFWQLSFALTIGRWTRTRQRAGRTGRGSGWRQGSDDRGVAAAAGVSVPTVSKVLNGRKGVSVATRREVERLLVEHGYERRESAEPGQRAGRLRDQRARDPVGDRAPARSAGRGRALGCRPRRHHDARESRRHSRLARPPRRAGVRRRRARRVGAAPGRPGRAGPPADAGRARRPCRNRGPVAGDRRGDRTGRVAATPPST